MWDCTVDSSVVSICSVVVRLGMAPIINLPLCVIPIYGHMTMRYAHIWSYANLTAAAELWQAKPGPIGKQSMAQAKHGPNALAKCGVRVRVRVCNSL